MSRYLAFPHPVSRPSHRRQRGVSMIEALVTLAIFSFGLLGAAGLMLSGINRSNVANMRSIATMQANEIVDRMRANIEGVKNSNYATASIYAAAPPSCANPNCETASCAANDVAAYDACKWNQRNAQLLPYGRGVVEETIKDTVHSFDIAVCWNEDKGSTTTCATDSTNTMNRLLVQGVRP
jgi:type IV pilus assembly protein PilV